MFEYDEEIRMAMEQSLMFLNIGEPRHFPMQQHIRAVKRLAEVVTDDERIMQTEVICTASNNYYQIISSDPLYRRTYQAVILEQRPDRKYRCTNICVMIKIITQESLTLPDGFGSDMVEISIMDAIAAAPHPNLLSKIEVCRDISSQPQNRVLTITPFISECSPDLSDFLEFSHGIDENFARKLTKHLLAGLNRLQQFGIAHRNLCPETIRVKIGDDGSPLDFIIGEFGHCIQCARLDDLINAPVDSLTVNSYKRIPKCNVVGKSPYVAPEVLWQATIPSPIQPMQSDLWSVGTIVLESVLGGGVIRAALGCFPNYVAIARDRRLAEWVQTLDEGIVLSDAALDLLQSLLIEDPYGRPTVQQALEHPWLIE